MRVLLDPGSSIPVMSFHKARTWKLPLIRRSHIRTIMGFNAAVDTMGGRYYTEAVVLRHQEDHYTRLSFELSAMDDECDIILPHWWLQQHEPACFFDKTQEIKFATEYCQKNCTSSIILGLPPTGTIVSHGHSPATFTSQTADLNYRQNATRTSAGDIHQLNRRPDLPTGN